VSHAVIIAIVMTDISKSGLIHAMRPGARVPWVNVEVGDHEHEEAWKRRRIPAAGHSCFSLSIFLTCHRFTLA
jgi:hypothetical protein